VHFHLKTICSKADTIFMKPDALGRIHKKALSVRQGFIAFGTNSPYGFSRSVMGAGAPFCARACNLFSAEI